MAVGGGKAVGRLPFFGALEIRGDLFFERLVVNLGRERDGAAASLAANLEREALFVEERSLILIAMRIDIAATGGGEIPVVEPYGRAVRIEVDNDSARRIAHGAADGPGAAG